MTAISNRYEFVFFLTLPTATPMVTRMQAICRVSTLRPIRDW